MKDDLKSKEQLRAVNQQLIATEQQLRAANKQLTANNQQLVSNEEKINHLNKILRAIRNVNQLITKEKDRDRLIKKVCENLIETRGYFNAWIILLDSSGNYITFAESGLAKNFLPMLELFDKGELTACGKNALKRSDIIVTENPFKECRDCPLSGEYTNTSGLTARLEYEGKIYGLASASIPKKLINDEEEHSLFKEVIDDIAFALHSIEVEKKRKQAEEKLKESEDKFRAFYEKAPLSYQSLNKDGTFIDVNPTWLKTLGYKKEEVIGNKFSDFLHPDWKPHFEKNFPAFKICGYVHDVHFKIRHKDGHYLDISFEGSIGYYPDGNVKQTYCTFQDITEKKQAEKDLLESEKKYRLLYNNAIVGIGISGKNGNILEANKTMCKIMGYNSEEISKVVLLEIFVNLENRNEILELLAKDGKVENYEIQLLNKKKKKYWANLSSRLIDYKNSKAILTTVIDITKRKKTEEKLRESIELSTKLISTLPDVIIRTDIKGNIVYCNDSLIKLYPNISFEDLLGKNMLSFFSEKDRSIAEKNTKLMFEKSLGVKEYQIQLANVIYDFEVNGEVLRDTSSKPTGMVYVLRDITERKEVEKALQESEEKYRLITLNTMDTVWTTDLEFNITFVNNAIFDFLGYTPEEFINLNPTIFTTSKGREILQNAAEQLIAKYKEGENNQIMFELKQIRKDGTIIDVEIRANLLLDNDQKVIGFQGRSIDITDRKLTEENIRKRNEELELFNKMSINRELKMIELKKEINDLLEKTGKEPAYEIVE